MSRENLKNLGCLWAIWHSRGIFKTAADFGGHSRSAAPVAADKWVNGSRLRPAEGGSWRYGCCTSRGSFKDAIGAAPNDIHLNPLTPRRTPHRIDSR